MPVNVIGTLKPKNNGKFPVAEAVDIKVTEELRLDEALNDKANQADMTALNSRVNSMCIIPESYGAVGDGVTDDTEAIADAIAAIVTAGGGTLLFTKEAYKCNIQIKYSDFEHPNFNLKLSGNKSVNTKLIAYDTEKPVIELLGNEGYVDTAEFVRYCTIENLMLTGATSAYALSLKYVQEIRLSDCSIRENAGNIYCMNCYDSYFVNVVSTLGGINNQKFNVWLGGQSNANHFTNCHFEHSSRFVHLENYTYHNVFTSCKFEKGKVTSTSSIGAGAISLYSNNQNSFIGCVFVNSDADLSNNHVIDSGQPFISSDYADSKACHNFIGCVFTCSSNSQSSVWFKGGNLNFIGCDFNGNALKHTGGIKLGYNCKLVSCSLKYNRFYADGVDTTVAYLFEIAGENNTLEALTVDFDSVAFACNFFKSSGAYSVYIDAVMKNYANVTAISSLVGATSLTVKGNINPKTVKSETTGITVSANHSYYTSNATSLKNVYGGYEGQTIDILCENDIEISNEGNIYTPNYSAMTFAIGDIISLMKCADSKWRMIGRTPQQA